MQPNALKDFNERINHLINARRLTEAINTMNQLLNSVNASWEERQELRRISESYAFLADYALKGVDDPLRPEIYDNIVNGIKDLLARINRKQLAVESTKLFYSTLRYEQMQSADTIASLIEAYRKRMSDLRFAELAESPTDGAEHRQALMQIRADVERIEKRLFNRVWVTFPLGHDDYDVLSSFLADEVEEPSTRMLIVSALLMSLLSVYDDRAMRLLLGLYYNDAVDESLRMRALTAFLMALSIHRSRHLGKKLREMIDTVRESPDWEKDVKVVALEFIRTRDTEKINRKMQDEVIPQMLKLRPEIYKKISENQDIAADMANIDENPEWQDMLESSGIADKLREIQEMQEDGADVMMSTFAQLKSFPFFNDVANWFLPFRPTHTAFALIDNASAFASLLDVSGFLCDSDKYSIILSLGRMPASQREMMQRQFDAQNLNMKEIRAASLEDASASRVNAVRDYVRDIYRFFKVFRRKGEFRDPFLTSLNLATLPGVDHIFDDPSQLSLITEFYFKRGYYEDALQLYRRLVEKGTVSVPIYQKMGFALQNTGKISEALEQYKNAEMMAPDNVWTLRRIAGCYRALANPREALTYYQRIAALKPEDVNVALHLGHCFLEVGNYREALANYFKVEFLDEKSTRALRPIAWTSFLLADYERSADYYSRIPADTLTSGDYLNMGHLAMATKQYELAIDRYRTVISMEGGDPSGFARLMQSDLHYLRQAGVDDLITGIVLDKILSTV